MKCVYKSLWLLVLVLSITKPLNAGIWAFTRGNKNFAGASAAAGLTNVSEVSFDLDGGSVTASALNSQPLGGASGVAHIDVVGHIFASSTSRGLACAGPLEDAVIESLQDILVDPFGGNTIPSVGESVASLDLSFGPIGAPSEGIWLRVRGSQVHSADAFIEIALLDATGLSDETLEQIFEDFGSVHLAVESGFLSPDRIMRYARESEGPIIYQEDVWIPPGVDYVVTSMVHSFSVPEPATLALFGLGSLTLLCKRKG
jgi:hypothetical protein